MPLTARLSALPCRGGEVFLRKLFEPLGYEVSAQPHALDESFSDRGQSRYFTVTLRHTATLQQLLTHLYVLIPVLDDDKHYWVDEAELEKLLRHGEGWLGIEFQFHLDRIRHKGVAFYQEQLPEHEVISAIRRSSPREYPTWALP